MIITLRSVYIMVILAGFCSVNQLPVAAQVQNPNAIVSRSKCAYVIYTTLKNDLQLGRAKDAGGYVQGQFQDVPSDHPHAEAIEVTRRMTLFIGHPDGTFGMKDVISRCEAAAILARLIDFIDKARDEAGNKESVAPPLPENKGKQFSDVSYDMWSYSSVERVVQAGIMQTKNGNFYPKLPLRMNDLVDALSRLKARLPKKQ